MELPLFKFDKFWPFPKGMMDFLSSDHGIAKDLRKYVIFKFFPVVCPDGVFLGNSRYPFIYPFFELTFAIHFSVLQSLSDHSTHISWAVPWIEKISLQNDFSNFFRKGLERLKSWVWKKSGKPFLRKVNFTVFHYTTRVPPGRQNHYYGP